MAPPKLTLINFTFPRDHTDKFDASLGHTGQSHLIAKSFSGHGRLALLPLPVLQPVVPLCACALVLSLLRVPCRMHSQGSRTTAQPQPDGRRSNTPTRASPWSLAARASGHSSRSPTPPGNVPPRTSQSPPTPSGMSMQSQPRVRSTAVTTRSDSPHAQRGSGDKEVLRESWVLFMEGRSAQLKLVEKPPQGMAEWLQSGCVVMWLWAAWLCRMVVRIFFFENKTVTPGCSCQQTMGSQVLSAVTLTANVHFAFACVHACTHVYTHVHTLLVCREGCLHTWHVQPKLFAAWPFILSTTTHPILMSSVMQHTDTM